MATAESMVAAMDSLWFHHIILFSHSQPSSSYFPPPPPQLHSISPSDEICTQETDVLGKETATHDDDHERATRLNLAFARGRSHSSSSPISALQKRWRNRSPLKKSSSLKSMADLELEEVKGFMDLGFVFRRENLTKRIIHLVPGLQREEEDEERKKEIIRPYLSEAWIVRRPSISPLMNDLRIPAVSTAADMKKHLRFWAHTVASAIHQES